MATIPSRLGEAASTAKGFRPAIALLDRFLMEERTGDPCFANLSIEYVEGDNLMDLLRCLAAWLAVTPIENRNSKEEKKYLEPSTIVEYFRTIKQALHIKFPADPCWENVRPPTGNSNKNQVTGPPWFTETVAGLTSALSREKIQSESGYANPKVRALYKKVQPIFVRALQRENSDLSKWKEQPGVDLEGIIDSMIKSDMKDKYLSRCMIVCTYLGVGRGGESKFLRWDNWIWDSYLECPDILWASLKTTSCQPMLFGPDAKSYICDFYHSFGAYFACEEGLFRRNLSIPNSKYVFPSLHHRRNEWVTTTIGNRLRRFVADKDLEKTTSAKSLRRGANTFLAMNRHISSEEQRVRGGWSSGNTGENYTEINPALTLPGALALGGWDDPHSMVYPPRIQSLTGDKLEIALHTVEKLFVVSVPQFSESGILRPFLQTCAASMMMYHEAVKVQYHNRNTMVVRLEKAMKEGMEEWQEEARCTQGRSVNPYLNHMEILKQIGEQIRDDFKRRNNHIPPVVDSQSLMDVVHRQALLTKEMNERMEKLEQCNEQLLTALTTVIGQLTDMATQMNQSENNPTTTASITPATNRKRARADEEKTEDHSEETVRKTTTIAHHHHDIPDDANSGKEIKQILVHWYENNALLNRKTSFSGIDYPGVTKRNKTKFAAAVELIEISMTEAQRIQLTSAGLPKEQLLNLCSQIQEQALDKMAQLEKKPRGRTQGYYLGLGNRFIKFRDTNRGEYHKLFGGGMKSLNAYFSA